jgi:D-alanine-D-alanine ligase-like ATP-grasp enzyme
LGILLFGGLSVEHNVGHGSILESSEVVETIDAALVKVSVFILIIAILLVRVNHEI